MTAGIAIHVPPVWFVLVLLLLYCSVQRRNALPPPTGLHAELMSVNQVQITWDQTAKDNNITHYKLHYNSSSLPGEDAYIFLDPLHTGYQLTNLLQNTTCNIDLSWTNGRGESAKTDVIQIRTPLGPVSTEKPTCTETGIFYSIMCTVVVVLLISALVMVVCIRKRMRIVARSGYASGSLYRRKKRQVIKEIKQRQSASISNVDRLSTKSSEVNDTVIFTQERRSLPSTASHYVQS